MVVDVAHETARAVAALLDLVAGGAVEDAVAEVDARCAGRLDDQDLVAADAEAPVAEPAQLRCIERQRRARRVEHDEVVARALHLGEPELHGRPIMGGAGVVQYRPGSPGGRVLKRLCTHRYWAGSARTSDSIQRFMAAVSACASSLGKSLHGSRKRTR